MATEPKYTTTVVGSHSVPTWYETLERQIELRSLFTPADMADVQYRVTQAALLDQLVAGIDIVTGGEMHRRTNNRHAPPNAMLNFFWQRLPGFSRETRPRAISPLDPNVFHPAAICRGPITYASLGLVEEWEMVSSYSSKPVKITMTSPLFLAKVAHDEYYGDIRRMTADLAKVINQNLRGLEEAGCRYIQIDEPLFGVSTDDEIDAGVEAINMAIEGLTMSVFVHVCQGNYAVGPEYDGQIGHRYFATGQYPAEKFTRIECDVFLCEYDMTPHYEGLLGNRQLAIGAADVQTLAIEPPELIVERVTRYSWLAPEQTLITSSCGMNHLPRHVAFGKLKAMADAKRLLTG